MMDSRMLDMFLDRSKEHVLSLVCDTVSNRAQSVYMGSLDARTQALVRDNLHRVQSITVQSSWKIVDEVRDLLNSFGALGMPKLSSLELRCVDNLDFEDDPRLSLRGMTDLRTLILYGVAPEKSIRSGLPLSTLFISHVLSLDEVAALSASLPELRTVELQSRFEVDSDEVVGVIKFPKLRNLCVRTHFTRQLQVFLEHIVVPDYCDVSIDCLSGLATERSHTHNLLKIIRASPFFLRKLKHADSLQLDVELPIRTPSLAAWGDHGVRLEASINRNQSTQELSITQAGHWPVNSQNEEKIIFWIGTALPFTALRELSISVVEPSQPISGVWKVKPQDWEAMYRCLPTITDLTIMFHNDGVRPYSPLLGLHRDGRDPNANLGVLPSLERISLKELPPTRHSLRIVDEILKAINAWKLLKHLQLSCSSSTPSLDRLLDTDAMDTINSWHILVEELSAYGRHWKYRAVDPLVDSMRRLTTSDEGTNPR
jgi:hypothetical protein